MQLRNVDKIQRVKQIITGLRDIFIYMECCKINNTPISVYAVYESVLEEILIILCEIEEQEKWSDIDEKNDIND